ncbi:MAG: hypothetical protein PHC53_00185 [Patescibacteria group bacterium]|nr:hypothetical protein [Patescibacteria group bacterium]
MQKNGFEAAKKIIVSLVILAMFGALVAPFSQVFAQAGAVQDPGESPPVDANPLTCSEQYAAQLIEYPTHMLSMGTGQLVMSDTLATLKKDYMECVATKTAKQKDWWYRRGLYLKNQWGTRVLTSIFGGLVDAMAMISQRIAYEAAADLLYGNPGNEPRFWNSSFDTWLENAGMDASSKFIDRLDVVVGDWTQSTTATYDPKTNQVIPGFRFSFCKPPNPYTLRLSLGLGEVARLGPGACNLKKVAENFKAIGDLVSSGDAIQLHRPTVQYGASDLSVGVETNSTYFNYLINKRAGLSLNRQEDRGLRPVMDVVSGKIKIPTLMMEQSYRDLSPTKMGLSSEAEQRGAIVSAYFQVGLENIPMLALTTFTNTLIVGLLHKWLDPKGATGLDNTATPQQITITAESLKNADATGEAQDLYERQAFAKALGDYLIPNFASTEDRDIISELTTCNTPRKRFNCAMDQALGVAIQVGTREGALTVGRASGIGGQGATFSPATQALHSDWEMVPESDIKNNTDPTCAQRAYCAGNLKKMRLARIITIGWEMAANSPYNTKHNGKNITLGEVIRGFYDCNDQGKLDKDHPWCHLIDPNWILMAPKYQCRATGFSDAILPGVGTRLEDCGDMVSCLKSNQNNECVGGYGYCLAERPAWKFEAQECAEQYVSCRTYNYVGGQVSLLRNTTDKGNCSEENMGCTWYATERYVTSTASPDNLWVSSVTSGPRVYFDRGAQPCSSEGCTKVFRVTTGQSALNLVQNGSFENLTTATINDQTVIQKVNGWRTGSNCTLDKAILSDAYDGTYSLSLSGQTCEPTSQDIAIYPGRYYVLSYYLKTQAKVGKNVADVKFYKRLANGSVQQINDNITTYGDCSASGGDLTFSKQATDSWERISCEFVSPKDVAYITLKLGGTSGVLFYDGVQLEESEVTTPFIDGVSQALLSDKLKTAYLKIAPDEYKCTGDDTKDHPGCKRFARVCRQTDVGCQGYKDVEDITAPEIPANLTAKDLCPAICAGYGEYRKLPSTFDLVKDPSHPPFDDPQDETTSYFIPGSLTEACSLEDVGCEPFTSMEAATSTGEKVAYYKDVRLCQKPNDQAATYFTWEGSDVSGYQIRTWSLIASDPANVTSSAPKLVLRGGSLGQIKDPATCNDVTWKLGNDPDCRQFYDVGGHVYYIFYSQTVSSDPTCTTYRKDDSTEADCVKTGGDFVMASKSCTYQALPSESLSCPATAGGCRAYLGPTGRNAINVFRDTFATGTQIAFDKSQGGNTTLQYSNESVLVGDRSLKLEAPLGSSIDATLKLAINSTSTLMRVSFWAKANRPRGQNDQPSKVMIDGVEAGTFYPDAVWSRFEVGPFTAKQNPTLVEIVAPSQSQTQNNIIYVDTFSVDQLNDVQFVRKNHWAIPLACDSTPEGTPEPRYMVGCREYSSRNGDTVFVRNFSRLCRDTAIGCSAFIDTNDKPQPYSETKTIKGTNFPADFNLNSYAKHGAAKAYEEQFFGDWSVTSQPYRYYYAIDDARGRCDSSQASCRGYGKPIFRQDRIALATTTYQVDPANADIYYNQKDLFGFDTVLFKDDWSKYLKDNGDPNMACRKDELFCDQFKSGNVTEYFRDPGKQACVWRASKKLTKNAAYNIPSDGDYSGWFREGTDIPCYPPYLSSGNNYLIQYTGESDYAGWGGKCPVDQSECTELVDPNDTSDQSHPNGRSYYVINGPKLDKSSCGGTADPLSGCILFQDKGVGTLQASSQATYSKVMAERGAAQPPIDCKGNPGDQYCVATRKCKNFKSTYNTNIVVPPGDSIGAAGDENEFNKNWTKYLKDSNLENKVCTQPSQCNSDVKVSSRGGAMVTIGFVTGDCPESSNDANVVIKVKMDRECARWMGCRTGETVYDAGQNKYVTQCTDMNICERNGSRNDDIYCSKFTERDSENFLSPGQYVDTDSYSGREVGFGKMDYSGLISPDHYLVADIQTRAVGYDLLSGSKLADRYRYDLRAVAEVPSDAKEIKGVEDPLFKVPGISLCKDVRTDRVGYSEDGKCILPISEASSLMLVAGQLTTDLTRDIRQLYNSFESGYADTGNNVLQSAMPLPECQIYPEEASPLPNQYVAEWNSSVNPPTPKKMVEGYEHANACVYKEDCSCSYRKVRYSGGERYYALDGAAPSVGICMGGDLDGQPCVPGGYVAVGAQNRVLSKSTVTDSCKGGTCLPIQDVVSVFGKYGYCLERDLTRISSASQTIAPCLTWSPMAVLGGKYDVSHRSPTASYTPPQGMGEYYCSSGANVQKLITPNVTTAYEAGYIKHWASTDFIMPGNQQQFAYSRPDVWWNTKTKNNYQNIYLDGSSNLYQDSTYSACPTCSIKLDETAAHVCTVGVGKVGKGCTNDVDCGSGGKCGDSSTLRVTGNETKNMQYACRRASLCEGLRPEDKDVSTSCDTAENRLAKNSKCQDANNQDGLWIQTGGGFSRSYLEYFIPYRPSFEGLQQDASRPNPNYFDYRFGLFRFGIQPDAVGSACKWNPKWFGMDYPTVNQDKQTAFSCTNFLQQVQSASNQITQLAQQSMPLILDRGSEELLSDPQGVPYKLGCLGNQSGSCYFKFWQSGFNDQDQGEFNWIDGGGYKTTPETFRWEKVYSIWYGQQCRSGRPYFAIRAMFQNVNSAENALEPDEARFDKLSGPWQFIGFWVTTCMPNQVLNDPGLMYLRLDIVKADVCKEVSQVIAPYTRESAAFADRVWAQGRFILPVLGLQYNSPNEPFGSALATKQIGNDPMLMGASVPLSGDYLKSPTFVDSGLSMQSIFNDQQNSWMPLSNLFARIYKVYRWSPYTVNVGDWACVKGDKMANKCSVNANTYQGLIDCGDYATCSDELDTSLVNLDWRCNALSGVNRGLSCGTSNNWTSPTRNSDPICHNAAVYAHRDSVTNNISTSHCSEQDTSDCVLSKPGCEPANQAHPDFLAYTVNSKDYDPAKKDFTINFKPFICTDQNFYAFPTLETVSANTIQASKWSDASMLLYAALKVSLKWRCDYNLDGSPPTCDPISDFCGQGQGNASVLGILAALNAQLIGANDSYDMRSAFKAAFDNEKSHPNFNGIDSSYNAFTSPLNGVMNLWKTKGITEKTLPIRIALGKWNIDRLSQLINYKCSADSVNADHRCLAIGSLPTDLNTFIQTHNGNQPIANDFPNLYKSYQTLYCPKRIDPCGTPGVPQYPYYNPPPGKSVMDMEGLSPPACGYCSLNDPTGWGASQNDQYYGKMPKDAQGKDTGYCVGFSKYSRCSTNADCTFNNFEYWGAHQEETRTDGILGYDYDNLTVDFPLLYLQDDKSPISKDPQPTAVNLPTPLFEKTDLVPGDLIKDEYRVPDKYSEPAVLTVLNSGDSVCLLRPVGKICMAIAQELFDRYGETNKTDGVALGYKDMHSGQSTLNKVGDVMAKLAQDSYWALVPGYNGIKLIEDICGDKCDPSAGHRKDYGDTLIKELMQEFDKCETICDNGAVLAPNGYAAHFEDIVNKSVATPTSKPVRTVSLAPFVVNPLWETIRSIGYSTNKTISYCEEDGDNFAKDNNSCCQGSSFQSSYVTAYFLKGLYYQYSWRFQIRNIYDEDKCGDVPRTWESYMPYAVDGVPLAGIFNITSQLTGTFLDNYPRFELLWPNGFDHRLQDLGKDTLVNDMFPWSVSEVYFTSLFPLLDKGYSLFDTNPAKILYNGAISWFQYMRIWSGFGYSEDLKNAFDNYLVALQDKTNKQAAFDNAKASDDKACSNQPDPLFCDYSATTKAQAELDKIKDDFTKAEAAYQKQYKIDMQDHYFSQTGWGTLIDENDPRLQLYPGALPAAKPLADKAASAAAPLKPIFVPGHCEPPKNGTDFDSKQLAARGVDLGLQDKDAGKYNIAGKPAFTWPAGGANDSGYKTWYTDTVYGGAGFSSGWHGATDYYNPPNQVQSDKLEGDGTGASNGYTAATYDSLVNITNPPEAYIPAEIVPDPLGRFGEDILMPAPVGSVGKISRTTCRCDGGVFDGQAMSSILDCNSKLQASENPFAQDGLGNLIHDPNVSYQQDPSAYCKPVSKEDGKPTDECQAKTGEAGNPDPDLDDNLCTHRPGYVPRGDVCADGRDQCLVTYNLHDNVSVDSYLKSKDVKAAPSATDVTPGLDTYHFLSGCGANGCDLSQGFRLKDDKQLTAPYKPQPPMVAAPDMTKSSASANAVPIAALDAFTINNLPQGLLFAGGGQSLVTMRFYAWTAHDQGPIKKIVIDWGDGTVNRIDYAQMKNQKPICNTDRECATVPGLACSGDADCPPGTGGCVPTGYCKKQSYTPCHRDSDCDQKSKGDTCEYRILFGNSPDACRQGYMEFGHVYKCETLKDIPDFSCYDNTGSDLKCSKEPNLTCDYCKEGESCVKGLAPQKGCFNEQLNHCRFTPRVMVFDNWGWCTGDCSNVNDGKADDRIVRHPNLGCYDGSQTKINSEVMSKPATSQVISSRPSKTGYNAQECADQDSLVINSFIPKDSIYYQRRPWIVYQGAIELQAGEQALQGLNLQSGSQNTCEQNCQLAYNVCQAQNKPNCAVGLSLCTQMCGSKIQ